ncbi:alkaline phosphatase family protein [Haloechinothrix sp. YIM 98757]|uniref:Alkaline phosphatase family protein n=1 Tax=Haloechinothrix aidingensis TaxID=2752311 RepID=A0A838A6X1_9PSEU|nr:phage holin family protein [Haloechinothrix aidingensis]MBA0124177.1 alkaline phosphatase family protein [Haloechinothrix aidingensis]
MNTRGARGRLIRGGRSLTRALLVWLAVTGALYVLQALLPGFAMDQWWQPTVSALLLGVLVAGVWPAVMRVALPVVFHTLGLASFLLLGAATLVAFYAVPGVHIADLHTAMIVVIAISAVGGAVSSLLAIDEDEIFFRRAAWRSKRSRPVGDDEPPGILFLQVDGLSYQVARRAIRDGNMPTLAQWLDEGTHTLTSWHTDWSAQTGASMCGILHGSNHDIPGYRWYEKERGRVMTCSSPRAATEIERRNSDGSGLLSVDGASRGNMFTGDASRASLTISSVALLLPKGLRRAGTDRIGAGYYAYFANPLNAVRTVASAAAEVCREVMAAAGQRRANVRPRVDRGGLYPFKRAGVTVLSRDVVAFAVLEDILAGRSVVYADFVGYDEVAHHSGIERFDTLATLRAIDQQIGRLWRAAELAPRDYRIVLLSDHGQTQGWAFSDRFGESIAALVARLCDSEDRGRGQELDSRDSAEGWQVGAAVAEAASHDGFVARRLRSRVDRLESGVDVEGAATGSYDVLTLASGHLALVSFTGRDGRVDLETIERHYPRLLPTLVDHPGIGFLLVHSSELGPVVLGRDGVHRLASGVVIGTDPLADYGPHAAELVSRVDTFPHCADIMVNSRYDPETDNASPFEPHVGSHGGLGGQQNHGFLLYPKEFGEHGEPVGAVALHRLFRRWLSELGHPYPLKEPNVTLEL